MPAIERPSERGRREGRRMLADLGEELRRARVAAGLSQTAVGRAAGMSHTKVGKIERARYPSVAPVEVATLLAVVGRTLSAGAYPRGSPVRDRAQLLLLDALRRALSCSAASH